VFRHDCSPADQRFETGTGLHRDLLARYEKAHEESRDFLGQIQDGLLSLYFWHVIRSMEPESFNPGFFEISHAQSFPNQLYRMFRGHMHDMLTVRDMADAMLMSESRFAHTCREILGIPPYRAFMNMKMERACHFLRNSGWSVKEISNELGFKDQYTFSRAFKNRYGVSPRNWRRGTGAGAERRSSHRQSR
jgi:AraC-like DNA-binding protein